jgi:hypothetical protein
MSASPSPGGGDNILNQLERDVLRTRAERSPRLARRLWITLAAGLTLSLLCALVWLLQENTTLGDLAPLAESQSASRTESRPAPSPITTPDTSAPGASVAPAPGGTPQATTPRAPPPASVPGTAPPAPAAASIVDAAPDGARSADALPALVMLRPPSPQPAQLPEAAPLPIPVATRALSASARATTDGAEHKAPAAPARPPGAGIHRARVAARPAPLATLSRAKKSPEPASAQDKSAAPADDTDIALLSAIILHARGHAAERAQLEAASCGKNKNCPAKAAPDPTRPD